MIYTSDRTNSVVASVAAEEAETWDHVPTRS